MIIDNTEYLIDAIDIVNLFKTDLAINNIDYLKDVKDGPKNIQITCPYHANGQEHKPSAGIRKSDGIFHCFACQATHTLPEVISYCFGYNDRGHYGKIWLENNIQDKHYVFNPNSISKESDINTIKNAKRRSSIKELDRNLTYNKFGNLYDDAAYYVSEKELDKYRWTHPYWAKRGIVEDWILELFDLGYDKEKQMITMPVRDVQGRCEFVAKRSVNTKFFQYPSGVSKPLYGLYELYQILLSGEKVNDVFVCESMIDCILLWQSGHYALALNGLGNDRQFKQLKNIDVNNLILATDNDKAGKDARKKIRNNIQNKWISEIVFPSGIKDIGECSKEQIDNILDWREYIVFGR